MSYQYQFRMLLIHMNSAVLLLILHIFLTIYDNGREGGRVGPR